MGRAWFPVPTHPQFILYPLVTSCPQELPPPPPPKLRGLCPTVEEPLVKPGVCVWGEDLALWVRALAAQGILGLISLVPISAQTVLLVFPVTAHTTPRKASSPIPHPEPLSP